MNLLFDINTVLPLLERQALILTPNRRLSAKVLAAYGQHQGQNQGAWPTPRVVSMDGWLQQLWENHLFSHPDRAAVSVLSSRQELILWEQLIADDPESSPLLKPSGIAQQCQQALSALELWQLRLDSDAYQQWQNQPDLFACWCATFRAKCQASNVISKGQMLERLLTALQQQQIPAEAEIQLLGFQDIPPLQQQILESATDKLVTVDPPARNRNIATLALRQSDEELEVAAQWAAQLQQYNSDLSIGVVIPDLHQRRNQVERVFRRYLQSDYLSLEQTPDKPPFNLSIGSSLAESPIIQCALNLLELAYQKLSYEQLYPLLHHPNLPGFETELQGRIMLEQRLRRSGKLEFSLHDILTSADAITDSAAPPVADNQPQLDFLAPTVDLDTAAPQGCPLLLDMLNKLQQQKPPTRQLPSDWAQWFQAHLHNLGWPGNRSCSSIEYQQLNQWYESLTQYQCYDQFTGAIDYSRALKLLRDETRSIIFQPKTEDSSIQILGPLEAAGLQFDYLWVMGMNDNQWPPNPSPDPLLPVGLQRRYQLPHASAERELKFAEELTSSFISNAVHITFSHSQWLEDQPLRPSGLISAYPAINLQQLKVGSTAFDDSWAAAMQPASRIGMSELEPLDTSLAPTVDDEELTSIRGGSSLLKQQALCPFSAFAIHRLGARPLDEPVLGLSAADRGNLVHYALENFWKNIKTRKQLIEIEDDNLAISVKSACQAAIAKFRYGGQPWMSKRFWQLELSRLEQLLERWLEVEKQRPDFKVFSTEESFQTQICGLTLNLRIDRIDQLTDNSYLLIDYKTGSPKSKDWFGDRPREPQLPLYAISSHKAVSAISFATISAKKQEFQGVMQGDQIIAEGIDPVETDKNCETGSWPAQLADWRQQLEALISGFLSGHAMVDPLDAQAYDYTGLEPLVRLYGDTSTEGSES